MGGRVLFCEGGSEIRVDLVGRRIVLIFFFRSEVVNRVRALFIRCRSKDVSRRV